jgi:hypothetical protein
MIDEIPPSRDEAQHTPPPLGKLFPRPQPRDTGAAAE